MEISDAISVNIIAHHIPSCHTVSQLKIDTTQKAIPFDIPRVPFALSRCLSSKSKVIMVDIAILRIFQTTTASMIVIIRTHRIGLDAFVNTSIG